MTNSPRDLAPFAGQVLTILMAHFQNGSLPNLAWVNDIIRLRLMLGLESA